MGFGLGFRVAPGVRLRAPGRGPPVSLGPRIARVHLGGGRSAVSAGKGPLTVWSTLSGGGHRTTTPAGQGTSREADDWSDLRGYLDGLLSAHTQPVTRSVAPLLPRQPLPRRGQVRRALVRDARDGAAWWHLGRWVAAWRQAGSDLDAAVTARHAEVQAQDSAAQAEADRWWRAVLTNDPDALTAHLEQGLAEHAIPATVTAVEGDTVHVVLAVHQPEELIGPREPTITEAGNLSLARMTKTRRHELYRAAIGSAVVATAAEVFARGPGVANVDVAVVAPRHIGGPAVLLLAALPRDLVLPAGADRPASGDLVHAAEAGRASLVQDVGGQIQALRPLDPEDEEIEMILDALEP
ncbi:MAG: DUF4236 domain-containing protein [Nitriliruptoraceae bacterium]|nr:DUF4236 domain-containing protein [Nitriliruptoraceae bacterium]